MCCCVGFKNKIFVHDFDSAINYNRLNMLGEHRDVTITMKNNIEFDYHSKMKTDMLMQSVRLNQSVAPSSWPCDVLCQHQH